MKKYLLVFISMLLTCCAKGQESNDINQKMAFDMFQNVENEMKAHYASLSNNKMFEDPLGRVNYLFEAITRVAPKLLSETNSYKNGLLHLLADSSFQKKEYSDLDIIYILYNLQIDDYVDLLEHALSFYKQNNIDQSIFENLIFQDFNVSNSLAKNYRNPKLQVFLEELLKDKDLINKMQLNNKLFQQAILDLKSGTTWNGVDSLSGLKKLSEAQCPILDTLKYKVTIHPLTTTANPSTTF